ncbi:MAG: hypothetical protein RIR31_249 [Bacteroidota bacterium]|jgi:hypothetical protein
MYRLLSSLSIVTLLICATQQSFSQTDFSDDLYYSNKITYEVGASLGAMNCLTDLGGGKGPGKKFAKDINMGKTRPEGSIFISAIYKNAVVLRTEATWGIVTATDAVLKNIKESTYGRYDRNLNFRSSIFEISLVSELHPRFFKQYTKKEKLPRYSPYLLGGIGYFTFNPQARIADSLVDLRPLATEGQGFAEYPERKIYKLKQINFPVGAGIKYKVSEAFNFSAEFVYRILNTDYLDDVSTSYIDKNLFPKYLDVTSATQALALYNRQNEINPNHITNIGDVRGNPKKNDAYFSLNFKIAVIF